MELDGVFIDLYGTLTAGDRAAVAAVCESLVRDHALSLSAQELSVAWGERFLNSLDTCRGERFLTLFDAEIKTLRETMSLLGVEINPLPYCLKLQEYWRNPPLQPEAFSFIENLRYPLCIVSNADRGDAWGVVKSHALRIDHVVTSEETRSYKPDRGIFDIALQQTGWRRERVVHVGDSLHSDIGGAIAAGIRSVWINRAHRIHDIGTHVPHHEFEDLTSFAAFLGRAS